MVHVMWNMAKKLFNRNSDNLRVRSMVASYIDFLCVVKTTKDLQNWIIVHNSLHEITNEIQENRSLRVNYVQLQILITNKIRLQ